MMRKKEENVLLVKENTEEETSSEGEDDKEDTKEIEAEIQKSKSVSESVKEQEVKQETSSNCELPDKILGSTAEMNIEMKTVARQGRRGRVGYIDCDVISRKRNQ